MSKWDRLIKYLNTTNADPDKVLNSVKTIFKPKQSKQQPVQNSYLSIRRAWKYHVVKTIWDYKKTIGKLDAAITTMIEQQSYSISYNAFHLNKNFKDKSKANHYNAAKKMWTESKELRKKLDENKGQIDPLELAAILVQMYKQKDGSYDVDSFLDDNPNLTKAIGKAAAKKKKKKKKSKR